MIDDGICLTQVGNAKIEGLTEDLNLSNVEYNTCLAIFFVPYIILGQNIPSSSWLLKLMV
jgi:hypothetical protein